MFNTKTNYKAFFFTHTALKPIQVGVQSAHALADMFVKYQDNSPEFSTLMQWASTDKTIVLRDGGNSANLKLILNILQKVCPVINAPFSSFTESEDYMQGLLTSVGFVVDRNAAQSVAYLGLSNDKLLEVCESELHGDGLSHSECYGILCALIDNSKAA